MLIPFNFQPESTSVKTSSYVIPAGKYAQVLASVGSDQTSTFTIDGSQALISGSSASTVIGVSLTDVAVDTTTVLYTPPAGYFFEGTIIVTATNSAGNEIRIGGEDLVQGGINALDTYDIKVGAGDDIAIFANSGNIIEARLIGYSRKVEAIESSKEATFWVPSGTTIAGTGTWRATVMEFAEIS